MAIVPNGYVFWDVSANKSYAAGKTYPAIGEGDYLVPASSSTSDGYYHEYEYHAKAYSYYGYTVTNGWIGYIQSSYKAKTQVAPFNTLNGKPVRVFTYYNCTFSTAPDLSNNTNLRAVAFDGCKNLTKLPNLPNNLESIANIASGCSKLTNINSVLNLSTVKIGYNAFKNCISLTGTYDLSNLTSLTDFRTAFFGCTGLTTAPTLPPNVIDCGWVFKNCTNLVTPPTIPSKVTSVYQMFYGCAKLKGVVYYNGDPDKLSAWSDCFKDTNKNNLIMLVCPIEYGISKLGTIAKSYDNVFNGVVPNVSSLTIVRGDYDETSETFNERASGEYGLLTANFSAPYVESLKVRRPYVYIDGSDTKDTTTVWKLKNSTDSSSVSGTVLSTDTGVDLPMSEESGFLTYGTIICLVHLGSESVSKTYRIQIRTAFTYDSTLYGYKSSNIETQLTFSEFIFDINPLGRGVGVFKDVSDEDEGVFLGDDLDVNGTISSSGNITSGGNISASGDITANGRVSSKRVTLYENSDGWEPSVSSGTTVNSAIANYSQVEIYLSDGSHGICGLSWDNGVGSIIGLLAYPYNNYIYVNSLNFGLTLDDSGNYILKVPMEAQMPSNYRIGTSIIKVTSVRKLTKIVGLMSTHE